MIGILTPYPVRAVSAIRRAVCSHHLFLLAALRSRSRGVLVCSGSPWTSSWTRMSAWILCCAAESPARRENLDRGRDPTAYALKSWLTIGANLLPRATTRSRRRATCAGTSATWRRKVRRARSVRAERAEVRCARGAVYAGRVEQRTRSEAINLVSALSSKLESTPLRCSSAASPCAACSSSGTSAAAYRSS